MVEVTSSGTAVVTLPTDTQILITRDFDAPSHLLYKAWTTPELIKRWWHAKRGEVTVADVDLGVGGTWRWVMVTTEGGFEVAFHGEYREIVPNERMRASRDHAPGHRRRRNDPRHNSAHANRCGRSESGAPPCGQPTCGSDPRTSVWRFTDHAGPGA